MPEKIGYSAPSLPPRSSQQQHEQQQQYPPRYCDDYASIDTPPPPLPPHRSVRGGYAADAHSTGGSSGFGGASRSPLASGQRNERMSSPPSACGTDLSTIVEGLKSLYKNKIKPLETIYNFESFHSPCLTDSEIAAKPIVMLIGQYSVGKSTFIRYILERDYPGIHIGPEPTTDRFVAVMSGTEEQVIPGNAAAVSSDLPFRGLNKFGTAFLSRFQVSKMPCTLLDNVTLIDTPGILSGDKQRLDRGYDMTEVLAHFAERADLILCCFDCHKLDISDEFKDALRVLRGSEEKIRVILNKADAVSGQQLLRVYGALMWSLGRVIQNPEVIRVYIGSFWERPLQCVETKVLLEAEQRDLLRDLRELPGNSAVRKVNEIVKRARLAKVHAFIIGQLKKEMPSMFGKQSKQAELIDNLEQEFLKVQQRHHLPVGDFPNVDKFRTALRLWNFEKFHKLRPKVIEDVDTALSIDFPRLMAQFPQGNALLHAGRGANPFEDFEPTPVQNIDGPPPDYWAANSVDKTSILPKWQALGPVDGKASGSSVRALLTDTRLTNDVLAKIWKLSDWGGDGYLDFDEFAVLCHLIKLKNYGVELPPTLPESLKPPIARCGSRDESGRQETIAKK